MNINKRHRTSILLGLVPLVAAFWIGCSDEGSPTAPPGGDTPPPVNTNDSIPPARVTQLMVKSPGVESLALQWVAPGNDGWEGRAKEYDIRYSNSPITEDNWDQATPISRIPEPIEGGTVQKCRAYGLVPHTTYHFALKTRDYNSNESPMSNVAWGITKQETTPPSPITDLVVTEVSTGQYLLTWTASGDDGVLGTASKYDIRFSTNGVITENTWAGATRVSGAPLPKAAGDTESFVVTVNEPAMNHAFAVKVGDEVTNWSEVSNPGFGLGGESNLWTYPENLRVGDELIVVFRAPGEEFVDVEVYYTMGACGSGDYELFAGVPESGIYMVKFDFYDEESDKYLDPNWYQISVCFNGQREALDRVDFRQ